MTIFENIKLKNIDELAQWISEYAVTGGCPWDNWFDKNYCNKCETVIVDGSEYAWCELNCKCRYFQDMDDVPNYERIIKMWLELDGEC